MKTFDLLLMTIAVGLLLSCSTAQLGTDYGLGGTDVPIRPKLEVFIAPKDRVQIPMGTALLCRIDIPYHDQAQRGTLKKVIKGALLQTGLFNTLVSLEDVDDYSQYVESGVYEYALDHGLRYCIEVYVEKLVSPVGDSPGFCAISLKIKRTRDKVTIYSAYGEADLLPRRERDFIFFTTPHRRAPTTLQGIISIFRAMAHELNKGGPIYS